MSETDKPRKGEKYPPFTVIDVPADVEYSLKGGAIVLHLLRDEPDKTVCTRCYRELPVAEIISTYNYGWWGEKSGRTGGVCLRCSSEEIREIGKWVTANIVVIATGMVALVASFLFIAMRDY